MIEQASITAMKNQIKQQAQGATTLNIAFIGIVNGLFDAIGNKEGTSMEIAVETGLDPGYVERWCDGAYAFGLLESEENRFRLSPTGDLMRPSHPQTAMPQVIQSALGSHMSERIAGLMRSGERPGEVLLGERETTLPWFGPMLEATFAPLFESQIFPKMPIFNEMNKKGALVIDLGCGNGWYLRALGKTCPALRAVGVDGFQENIRQAKEKATEAGLQHRLRFIAGDIFNLNLGEKADMITMNRALHHVWSDKERLFPILRSHLSPGGALIFWEPAWPMNREELRKEDKRPLSFQNLGEHAQGNHLLNPDDIALECRKAGLSPTISLFINGNEAVVVARDLS